MRPLLSGLVHHVLKINLIKTRQEKINIVHVKFLLDNSNLSVLLKELMTTSGISHVSTYLLSRASSLQKLKCSSYQASIWKNRSFFSHWRQYWRWSWCQPWCRKRSEFSWGRIVHCCGQSWRWRRWELWTQDPSTPSAPGWRCSREPMPLFCHCY